METAFGNVTGPRAHWWWTHVVGPLSKGTTRGSAATSVVESLEQRPGHSGQIEPVGRSKKAKAKMAPAGRSQEVCYPWNDGGCTSPCPNGRQHRCRHCSSTCHRGFDCPQRPTKGKGKGNGKNKDQGTSGKGGNDTGAENQGGRKRKRGGRGAKTSSK